MNASANEGIPTPVIEQGEDSIFNHIPKLGPQMVADDHTSLLPLYGGIQGFTYYQCPLHYRRAAQDDGWLAIHGNKIYTIRGPKGQIDCELLARGARIFSSDSMASRRKMVIHPDIGGVTGLSMKDGFALSAEEPATERTETSTRVTGVGTFSNMAKGTPIPFDDSASVPTSEVLEAEQSSKRFSHRVDPDTGKPISDTPSPAKRGPGRSRKDKAAK